MTDPTMPRYTCTRCGHVWIPRADARPQTCAHCRSPYWDRPRIRGMAAEAIRPSVEEKR